MGNKQSITEEEFDRTSDDYIEQWIKAGLHKERSLSGVNLLNTIAYYLGHQVIYPKTEKDEKNFEIGQYFMFDENALKHSTMVMKAMLTPEGHLVKMKILPVLLYYDNAIIRLVVFEIKKNDRTFFVDTKGRKYKDYNDWRKSRELPNGKVAFLERLYIRDSGKFTTVKENVIFGCRKFFQILDGAMLAMNITSAVLGLLITPLGTVFMVIGIVTRIYGAIRAGYHLYDRKVHGQSISILNPDARRQYLNLVGQLASASVTAVSFWMLHIDPSILNECHTLIAVANVASICNLGLNAVSGINDIIYLSMNWKKLDKVTRFFIIAQIAFAALACLNFQTADQMIEDIQRKAVDELVGRLTPEQQKLASGLRNKVGNLGVLKQVNAKASDLCIPKETAFLSILESSPDIIPCELTPYGYGIKLVDICADVATDMAVKNATKIFDTFDMNLLLEEVPRFIIDFAVKVSERMASEMPAEEVGKIFTAIVGILSSIKSEFPRRYHETRNTTVTPNAEEPNTNRENDTLTEYENNPIKQWQKAIHHFNRQSPRELKIVIKDLTRNVGDTIRPYKVKKAKTDESLKEIICNIDLRFETEANAIFHCLLYSLYKDQFSVENYFNEVKSFLESVECSRQETLHNAKYFYYERNDPYGYAVVKFSDGYLSLCTYREHRM